MRQTNRTVRAIVLLKWSASCYVQTVGGVVMRRMIGFLLGVLLLGGCAVYADPVPPGPGVYVAPPPAVVIAPRPWWGWGWGWHGRWR